MPRKSAPAATATATAAAAVTELPVVAAATETLTLAPAPAPAPVPTATAANEPDDAALKNINYKNMLLTGNYGMLKPDIATNPNIDNILENEKNATKSDPWNKLDKSAKVCKLKEFATRHGNKENHSDQEITGLYQFLVAALEQKKLMRAKDVIYDKTTGLITSIPCLIYNAGFKKFTLKRCEKRQSTLKSLAPTTSMSKKRKLAADNVPAGAAAATAAAAAD
jgi:hypothetical protein